MNMTHEMQFTLSNMHIDCFGYARPAVLLYTVLLFRMQHRWLLKRSTLPVV